MDLKIDETTLDLVIMDGAIQTVIAAEEIAQCVRSVLLAWQGEWMLDTRHGTDYAAIVDAQMTVTQAQIHDIIATAIYQEPSVQSIDGLQISIQDRVIQVRFTARLKDGSIINVGVSANG